MLALLVMTKKSRDRRKEVRKIRAEYRKIDEFYSKIAINGDIKDRLGYNILFAGDLPLLKQSS
jgi:hypothetical protein